MTSLELLPAIDVKDGKAVRLVQGELAAESQYGDPREVALEFLAAGAQWIHLVDLDAAFGIGSNAALLEEVIKSVDLRVELSGGIRDDESLRRALATGCAAFLMFASLSMMTGSLPPHSRTVGIMRSADAAATFFAVRVDGEGDLVHIGTR